MVEGFKNTDAGIIPIDWNAPVLSEIADFENGKAHEQFIDDKGDFIVVNSKFISQDGRVAKYSKANLSPLAKGDIAIVMSDIPNGKALAKCFSVDKENRYTLNQRIGCIKPFEEIDNDYLFYKLNRNKYFLAFDSGSGQTNLKKSEILACPVALPPTKTEQTAIATAIKDADKLITHLEKLLTKKRNIKAGAMQELLKPKDGWVVKTIEELCMPNGIVRGPFGGALKKEFFVPRGYKVYEQKNAIYRNVDSGNYYIDKDRFKELQRFELLPNDFIISCSGTIGKIYQMPETFEKGIINQALLKLTFDSLAFSDRYFYHYFSWDNFQESIIDSTQGGAMKNLIGMSDFKKTTIPLPKERNEQAHIALILSDMDNEIQELEKKLEKQKMMKQGMMQSLLTGSIRLTK